MVKEFTFKYNGWSVRTIEHEPIKMKENEPKVKDSQKFWDENKYCFSRVSGIELYSFRESDKEVYDRLVSLEAKIELLMKLKMLCVYTSEDYLVTTELGQVSTELAELVKELKL